MVWQVEVQTPKVSTDLAQRGQASDARAEMKDVYTEMAQGSDLSMLPLVVAAYPAESANSLLLATSPGTGTTTKQTSTLDVTLPGSDLLVDFSADIDWALSENAYSTSSGSSSVTTTIEETSHTHQVTVGLGSHEHVVDTSTATASSGFKRVVSTLSHNHVMFNHNSGRDVYGGALGRGFESGGDSNRFILVGFDSSTSQMVSGASSTGYPFETNVASDNHVHDVGTVTAGTVTAGTALTTETIEGHFHEIDHTHDVGPTSAMLDIKAELLVDDTDITAGLSQFRVEGFTGKRGIIQLRSIYVLQKGVDNAAALSGGQHTVGLKFTVATIGFTATGSVPSTITAKNVALIIRDAAFDDRVKIFTP